MDEGWVVGPAGERLWGRHGAAGLLAVDPERGVLMQHRALWSHHGGTWGIPGGALLPDERPAAGALREAAEEAAVPADALRPRLTWVQDHEVWRYTTLVAEVSVPFQPHVSDPESIGVDWIPVEEVEHMPLHPGFASTWPRLREALTVRPTLLIDAANVVGSVPDGWWRDRAGAAQRLRDRLEQLAAGGVPAGLLGLAGERWFPEQEMVLEGAARGVGPAARVAVTAAPGSGDDTLVERATALERAGHAVTAVTSDRELARRLERAGARVVSAGRFLRCIGGPGPAPPAGSRPRT